MPRSALGLILVPLLVAVPSTDAALTLDLQPPPMPVHYSSSPAVVVTLTASCQDLVAHADANGVVIANVTWDAPGLVVVGSPESRFAVSACLSDPLGEQSIQDEHQLVGHRDLPGLVPIKVTATAILVDPRSGPVAAEPATASFDYVPDAFVTFQFIEQDRLPQETDGAVPVPFELVSHSNVAIEVRWMGAGLESRQRGDSLPLPQGNLTLPDEGLRLARGTLAEPARGVAEASYMAPTKGHGADRFRVTARATIPELPDRPAVEQVLDLDLAYTNQPDGTTLVGVDETPRRQEAPLPLFVPLLAVLAAVLARRG